MKRSSYQCNGAASKNSVRMKSRTDVYLFAWILLSVTSLWKLWGLRSKDRLMMKDSYFLDVIIPLWVCTFKTVNCEKRSPGHSDPLIYLYIYVDSSSSLVPSSRSLARCRAENWRSEISKREDQRYVEYFFFFLHKLICFSRSRLEIPRSYCC